MSDGNGSAGAVLDEARNYLRIVHQLPGRIRLRWPCLRELSAERRSEVFSRCVTHPGISNVVLKPLTGSLLVEYDTEHLGPRAVLDLVRDAAGARLVLGPDEVAPARPSRPPEETTRLALAAAKFFDDVNDDVRDALDGSADLNSLLPLGFLSLGLAEIAMSKEVPAPPWWSLFWWSFRSFLSLNEPAMEQADEE